ncbi:hypothetical protein [Saccharothrix violaceirubra]|uniref:Uncharacterized protein n=1 Tax=Saccharothrix violaceirubra TaxID=413306 RepID=A0A7W7T9P2_9PSEU|nr:hypothetical protein [Saccharothrix violaceirubra]MBB4969114.1 hypothetical protein [Saccharothrix violaceirubra]
MKALDDGRMWAWLEESLLEPVIVAPAEAAQALNSWRAIRDRIRRGAASDQQFAIIFTGEHSRRRTVLVFGQTRQGHMTYWRDGELLEPVPLDLNAVDELIDTWEAVACVAAGNPRQTAC